MASFPRAKVDSSTQTDPILPFTALLERALDSVEATVPLNLASITFYIRRHHLSRIEQIESLLSQNFFFKFVLFRIGLKPQHVFSFLCLLTLYGCRQLYRRSVYLTTNLCAVAYPAYCSIKTINNPEPIPPPRELGLEPTEYSPIYGSRRSSIYSTSSLRLNNRRRSRRSLNRMNEESAQSSNNSYSSSQEEDYQGRRSLDSSWGRPSDYSVYSEDNITSTSGGSGSMTVEEKVKQRMRRRWSKFSQTRKEKATRQWLAYWSIYGTVQVVDTWSSFLLDWIPGYNLGKLLFLWWAQRRGATLIFDYFQPLIQAKSRDGREVARKPSNRSLNSEISRHSRGGSSGGGGGGNSSGVSRPTSIQVLPSTLAQQQQQLYQHYQHQQPQYQQQQFEQQFNAKGVSRRDTAAFRDLNQGRYRNGGYDEDEDDEEEEDEFGRLQDHYQQYHQHQRPSKEHHQPMDLHRELMISSPHDSGAFAETSIFESGESVWSAPPSSTNVLVMDEASRGQVQGQEKAALGSLARLHSNNATPTPMSIQEQYHVRQQQQQQQSVLEKQLAMSQDALHSYAAASTSHWNPAVSSTAAAEDN
ncbi:hypothetical protein BGX28_003430 [Mortierella sp. GBA30]|nr:hypothetical protein BGX28_003430 [Mortierella sp. GBA30]